MIITILLPLFIKMRGYEGIRSFAIATTKVNDDILNYWLNQYSLYQPGAMKAAYGTFLAALMVEYVHDQVADDAASQLNVTWSRTSPIIVSAGDEAYQTYLTLECDHSMGMTVVGTPENIVRFNYASSSAISPIEYVVMTSLGFCYQSNSVFNGSIGSVMIDLVNAYLSNNMSVKGFIQNGYLIESFNNTDFIIIDLETGIVRDILLNSTIFGAYCYYDLQTDLAVDLGRRLISNNPAEVPGWMKFMPGLCINPEDGYNFPEISILPFILVNSILAENHDWLTATPGNTVLLNLISNIPTSSTYLSLGALALFLPDDHTPTQEESQEAQWKAALLLLELGGNDDIQKEIWKTYEKTGNIQKAMDRGFELTKISPDIPPDKRWDKVSESLRKACEKLKKGIKNKDPKTILIASVMSTM